MRRDSSTAVASLWGTTNYLYDGANTIEELDSSGSVLARYTQGLGVDEPLSELRSGSMSYYEPDVLGSITSLTSPSGTIANTYAYDSYGNLSSATGTVNNPFRYTGREFDSETGLYYYRARFYNPGSGRFVSDDPLGFNAGVNFYLYVNNNPATLTDPFGLDALTDDPNVRRCICELWKASGYGWAKTERAAWVQLNKDKIRNCIRWPWSAETAQETWKGPLPSDLDGLVHTHPTGKDPKPSTGCEKCDDAAAQKSHVPVYTISRDGIWKITPSGQMTHEANADLLNGFDYKTCECKKK